MGTKVLKLESKQHGSYQLETKGPDGTVYFRGHGTFHDVVPDQKIIRTFEMEGAPFGVQLEYLEFEKVTDDVSRLKMHIIYRSVADRDQAVQIGMGPGMNMAHNQLQKVADKLK